VPQDDSALGETRVEEKKALLPTEQRSEKFKIAEIVKKAPSFKNYYRKSNVCTRLFYSYLTPLVDGIKKNGKLEDGDIVDMTKTDGETQKSIEYFLGNLKKRAEAAKKKA